MVLGLWSNMVNLKSILTFCENAVFYDGFGPWSILIVFFKRTGGVKIDRDKFGARRKNNQA